MTKWQIIFRCELLEDMHCGSGLGFLGVVDDRHARDAKGQPVVWDSTLAGLLRDQADALQALGHPVATPERIRRLFGAEGPNARGVLVTRSLHFHPKGDDADRPAFLEVTSTAPRSTPADRWMPRCEPSRWLPLAWWPRANCG